jgi:hypothetical protein
MKMAVYCLFLPVAAKFSYAIIMSDIYITREFGYGIYLLTMAGYFLIAPLMFLNQSSKYLFFLLL